MSAPPPPAGTDAPPPETLSYGRDPSPDARPPGPDGSSLVRGSRVHRYTILDRVGEGGMGVVYAAYDPSLDRRVALKFLVPQEPARQSVREARLVREAQAMARLSHPNVAVVYEVGNFEGNVFLAMEFVDGVDLRAWLAEEPRTLAQIMDVFVGAGRGLAAAHAAGIVHRDFKPENVLLDEHDRPRVTDFGLSRASHDAERAISDDEDDVAVRPASQLSMPLTRTGGLLGTPSYMAPEQHRGAEADARADQFAFCVALYEALYGTRPFAGPTPADIAAAIEARRVEPGGKPGLEVPRWLRAVVMRGLEPSAEDRWPSMDALLAALSRDPRGARRRWIVGGGLVAGLVVAAMMMMPGEEVRACPSARDRVAAIWDAGTRAKVRAAFLATGSPIALDVFGRVERALDGRLESWVAAHREACVATRVRGEQSEAMLDLRMQCLERARRKIATLTEVWLDEVKVDQAVTAVLTAGEHEACADAEALARSIPPPVDPVARRRIESLRKKLDRVEALQRTGQLRVGMAEAREAVDEARRIGYAPVLGEALKHNGDIESLFGDRDLGLTLLHESFQVANAAHDDKLAATVARFLLYYAVQGDGRLVEGDLLAKMAEAAAVRVSNDQDLLADFMINHGHVLSAQGRRHEAIERLRLALDLKEKAHPDDDYQLAAGLSALSNALADVQRFEEALALNQRALAAVEHTLGPDSPSAAAMLQSAAILQLELGDIEEAVATAEKGVAVRSKLFSPDHLQTALGLGNLAFVHMHAGNHAEATRLYERVARIRENALGSDHVQVAMIRNHLARLALDLEDTATARRLVDQVLPVKLAAYGPDHVSTAYAYNVLGEVSIRENDLGAARAAFEKALSIELKQEDSLLDVALTRMGLAEVDLRMKRPSDAIAQLEAVQALLEARPETLNRFHVAPVMTGLGRAHLAAGRPAEAIGLFQRAIEIADSHGAPNRLHGARARFELARLLWSRRERDRSVSLAREALDRLAGRKEAYAIERWLHSRAG